MRVAVLGGTRFVGPPIVDALVARGHDVTVVHRGRSAPHRDDVAEVCADRGDRDALTAALRGMDALVDTCAYTRTDAEIAVAALPGSARAVALSSMDVYRAFSSVRAGHVTDPVPLTEASAVRDERFLFRGAAHGNADIDVDQYEKLDVEDVYTRAGGVVLRLPMVYGARDHQRREEFVLRRVRAGRERIPFGAGTWIWSRGWVADVGVAAALAAESSLSAEILNVCESQACTIELWARAILLAAGSPAQLVRVPDDVLPEDLWITRAHGQHILVDASRARRLLGWADTDPMAAITASVEWHLAHPPADANPDFSADDAALAGA